VTPLSQFLEILALVALIAERLAGRFGDFVYEFITSFPNLLKMADAVVGWMTSSAGIILATSASFYWTLTAQRLSKRSKEFDAPNQAVCTPEHGVLMCRDYIEIALQFFTLTSENNLVTAFAAWLGRMFWQTFKRFKFIMTILGIGTVEDAVSLFLKIIDKKRGTVILYAVLSCAVAAIVLCVAITGKVLFIGTMIEPMTWKKHVLFGQHKRKRIRTKIYRRVGGVAP